MLTARTALIALLVVIGAALAISAAAQTTCAVTTTWSFQPPPPPPEPAPNPPIPIVYNSIVAAINSAPAFLSGGRIDVAGECVEQYAINILEKFANLTLTGPSPTNRAIVRARGGDTAITIRGRSINIYNLWILSDASTVTEGIIVYRGGQAQIGGNLIDGFKNTGIAVSQSSYARIFNNTIQGNGLDAIYIADGGVARVGFISNSDPIAPNLIQNNGKNGVSLYRGGTARIYGNTITGNGSHGVYVNTSSHADIAWNDISGNVDGGVRVRSNSGVMLGKQTGVAAWDLPNTSTTPNGGFGVECSIGGVVDGDLGTLDGTKGRKQIRTGCTIVEW